MRIGIAVEESCCGEDLLLGFNVIEVRGAMYDNVM